MKTDNSPIEIDVPAPWRLAGRCAGIVCWLTVLGYAWRLFLFPEPYDDQMLYTAILSFICGPMFFLYCLPAFLGRYPSWVVRILGRRHLLKFIADSKKHLSHTRQEKAAFNQPSSWLRDQRLKWLIIIISFGILGVLAALIH